jgi:hypothetical protein
MALALAWLCMCHLLAHKPLSCPGVACIGMDLDMLKVLVMGMRMQVCRWHMQAPWIGGGHGGAGAACQLGVQ